MTAQTGDKVTIRRGKFKGQEGEVIAHQADPAAYVLKLGDGTHQVVNASNVIEPTEATITQGELAAIISTHEGDTDMDGLIHSIDSKYPGFARHFSPAHPVDSSVDDRDPRDVIPGY